jgi:hypothetical protein
MVNFLVPQRCSRIVALALLGAVMVTAAGASCLMPAASAHSSMAACHPVKTPSHPHPVDSRCCVSRLPSALLTSVFSPRPALPTLEPGAMQVLVAAQDRDAFPALIAPSGGPPGVLILRI